MSLTGKIHHIRKEIESWAKEFGLDFFETVFELVSEKELSEIAAYGGFPTRYPHWRFGMEFDQLAKGHEYGMHKIYELVINNDPCYAYLMRSNSMVDQKLVMAHVYAHCDFFKNNAWFRNTSRKMMDEIGNHASKVRHLSEKHGFEKVEGFIDSCLSIEYMIDVYRPYIHPDKRKKLTEEENQNVRPLHSGKEYMDPFLEGPLPEQKTTSEITPNKIPTQPTKDLIGFLKAHAPLAEWEYEVLSIIYKEALYFLPQAQTKIMNEGWASYWHSKIMTEKALKDAEIVDFADHHAGTLATQPGQVNPYKLGIELFRDIEERWNMGKFGREYEECTDIKKKRKWNQNLGKGRDKIFEVRKVHNDVTFIDEYLTPEFCERQKMFVYGYNKRNGTYEIIDRDVKKVKEKLLFSLTNFGQPIITVQDGNFKEEGHLLLVHDHQGMDLKIPEAKDCLERIYALWKKPVWIETRINGERRHLSYNGKEHQEKTI